MNFHQKFIKGFLQVAKPLLDLLKKKLSFEWGDEQQKAFEDFNKKISSSLVLIFFNFMKPFELHNNASNFAIGGVFMQDGHLINFQNKKLSRAQFRWPTHEKNLHDMVSCLKTQQHYLGTHKITMFTDNVSLKYFQMQPTATHWHNTLALMDVELIHNPSWDNVVLDALSQKDEYINTIRKF